MKTSLFLLVSILFYSSFTYSQEDVDEPQLCKILSSMVANDQKFRGSDLNVREVFPVILDSLILLEGLSKTTFFSYPMLEQSELRGRALQIVIEKSKPRMAENDSLRILQTKIDEENTKKLISIVEREGWLTAEKLGCQEKFLVVLIFRHAPRKYWKEVRALIEKEKSAKRISEYDYYIIDNHLKGRPPLAKGASGLSNE